MHRPIIQHRKSSIFRAVILVAWLEFTFLEKSFSNQKTCGDRNTGNISYFTLHSGVVNWDEAWRQCNTKSFTLPVICNQKEQNAFEKFLKENASHSHVWTSGRKFQFGEWKWVDGQSYTSAVPDQTEYYINTRAYFDLGRNYYRPTADDPRRPRPYLCHYSGFSCMNENVIQVKSGCIRPRNDSLSWFDARNYCVGDGGDLAIFDNDDLVTLRNSSKLNTAHRYWIGLGNNAWRWMWHKAEISKTADESGEEVKYTNWVNNRPDIRECMFIDALNGGWDSEHCSEKKKVICEANFGSDETTSRTSSPVTTSRPTISRKSSNTTNMPTVSIYSGVGAGIVILIICIIIIVLVVRCTKKPSKDTDHSKDKNSSELNGLELSPNKPATSPAYAPAIAPVAGTDDTLGVYAEITAAPLNQSEDEDKIQQPGVLYAALEFQKEPTYLEPNQKNANASDQTKVGPMGDIYAIPDAKSRTGNEPASHPVIVTSQGDVYALPLKNSKSPTANSPVGGIYANL